MKEFEQVLVDFNDYMSGNYDMNLKCLNDYEFAVVTGAMWKGSYAEQFANKPKPEINQIFGSINRLLGQKQRLEMNAKIISNSDEATDEDADLLQSLWRNDFQGSGGVEALNNADQESFFGGFGAYKLVTKYEDQENPDPNKQYICIEPIMSAASSVVFSPSVKKDKSDALQGWQIIRTNRKKVEDEYGVESISSVGNTMGWFDWDTDSTKDIYLAHYYEVVTKTLTDYDFDGYKITAGDGIIDQNGNKLTRQDLEDLKNEYEYTTVKRKVKRTEYALMSGSGFLTKPQKQPFKRVPIIPQYGYYAVLNGVEYYCGEVSKRRDPQMFNNTFASTLMEIMAAPQVEKPEYTPEQIARHASQRARSDIDGVPYLLSDPIKNDDGTIAHLGPVGRQTPPQIGTGLATAGQFLQGTLLDMSGTGQSTIPSNTSSDAIKQVNERQDDAFQALMQNSIFANKVACEIWLEAAQIIYFTNQRKLRAMSADGTYSQVETLKYGDDGKGNYGPFVNTARGRYSVQVKVGESHKSRKQEELETILKMLNFADTSTPQGQMLLNQAILSTTGEGGARARKVARYQIIDMLIMLGLDPEAENEEEEKYVENKVAQMQQPKQPTPFEQAELLKGQAALKEQENRSQELMLGVAKLQEDSNIKMQKQNSEDQRANRDLDIKEQKVLSDGLNNLVKNAITITDMENKYGTQLNQEIASNSQI